MIRVSHLTKYYGDYAAVRDVSFEVPAGQIVGFLGPNGAGKSTTMRILAGYLTATSGSATIAGRDVFWNNIEVRRKIGYMPESCPLYKEMRIIEYPAFPGRHQGHLWPRTTPAHRLRPGALLARRCRSPDHRHTLQGLSPARRSGGRLARQPAGADPR